MLAGRILTDALSLSQNDLALHPWQSDAGTAPTIPPISDILAINTVKFSDHGLELYVEARRDCKVRYGQGYATRGVDSPGKHNPY